MTVSHPTPPVYKLLAASAAANGLFVLVLVLHCPGTDGQSQALPAIVPVNSCCHAHMVPTPHGHAPWLVHPCNVGHHTHVLHYVHQLKNQVQVQ
jgi:hypothetical protein